MPRQRRLPETPVPRKQRRWWWGIRRVWFRKGKDAFPYKDVQSRGKDT